MHWERIDGVGCLIYWFFTIWSNYRYEWNYKFRKKYRIIQKSWGLSEENLKKEKEEN